jgi:hypothetical protein
MMKISIVQWSIRFALVLVLSSLASADLRAAVWFAGNRYETLADAAQFAVFFRDRGDVTLGREQRLPNGVSWRVQIDVRTGARMPRVTWMPERTRLATANRFLETAHGAAIMRIDEEHRIRLGNETIWRVKGGVKPNPPKNLATDVVLNYASKRFVGYVESGLSRYEGIEVGPSSERVLFDMETSQLIAEGHCWTRERSQMSYEAKPEYFDLGGLFDVCDDTTYTSFHAAALNWARRANPPLQWAGSSGKSCPQIAWQRVRHEDLFVVPFITHKALALYLGNDPMIAGPGCRSAWPSEEPVIIVPYRVVEPFMQPGPLRDELLASSP